MSMRKCHCAELEEMPLCFLFEKALVLPLSSTKPFLLVPVGGEQGADGYSFNPVN